MAADPTLVKGAFAAAMANVPRDYSRAYESMAKGVSTAALGKAGAMTKVAESITERAKEFKKLREEEEEARKKNVTALEEAVLPALQTLSVDKGGMNEGFYDGAYKEYEDMYSELETLSLEDQDDPNVKKRINEIMGQAYKMRDQLANFRGELIGTLEAIKNNGNDSLLDYKKMSNNDISFLRELATTEGNFKAVSYTHLTLPTPPYV